VFSEEQFDEKIAQIARSIVQTVSPRAALETKRQIYAELMDADVGACIEDSKRRIGKLMRSTDFKEAVAALGEKRLPRFEGLTEADR
jgi:enoyl-CoA hydratase/carnithine racemase